MAFNGKSFSSPVGKITLIADDHHLLALYINDEDCLVRLKAKKISNHPLLEMAQQQLAEYFSGKRVRFDIPLAPEGTKFQMQAWGALMQIPFGKVWSYGQQAKYLNAPNAQRAVGGANGKNPIPIIIPCHRVLGKSGNLTGFSAGMEMKIFLLRHEGHRVDSSGLKILSN